MEPISTDKSGAPLEDVLLGWLKGGREFRDENPKMIPQMKNRKMLSMQCLQIVQNMGQQYQSEADFELIMDALFIRLMQYYVAKEKKIELA